MSESKGLYKLLTILLSVVLFLSAIPGLIMAEDGDTNNDDTNDSETAVTVRLYEKAVLFNKFFDFNLDKSKYDTAKSNIPTTRTIGNVDDKFTAYYPNALDYYGENKSVKIEVVYKGRNRYEEAGDIGISKYGAGIMLESDKDISLLAMGMNYDITYSFYEDENFEIPAEIYGAIAFNDPDEGNYIFNGANTKKIYYIDKKGLKEEYKNKYLADYFNVKSKGIYQIDEEDTGWSTWIDFDNGAFGIPLVGESTFSFTAEGKHDVISLLSHLMQTHAPYKVEYYYETADGYPETPDFSSAHEMIDLYENREVSITDSDKIPSPDMGNGYRLNSTMNQSWKQELKQDGTTVLKVYFEEPYTIKYNPNCEDSTGEMKDNVYTKSSPNMNSDEDWKFERPKGWDFIGYKVENDGELLNGQNDYKNELLEETDREIVLYAQWDPWKYVIKYDPGCTDAKGEMEDKVYTYQDPTMNSEKNKYTRSGYKFVGFVYTDPEGNKTLYKSINDFREDLIAQEREGEIKGEILLVAQWEKVPESKSGHKLPETGIE